MASLEVKQSIGTSSARSSRTPPTPSRISCASGLGAAAYRRFGIPVLLASGSTCTGPSNVPSTFPRARHSLAATVTAIGVDPAHRSRASWGPGPRRRRRPEITCRVSPRPKSRSPDRPAQIRRRLHCPRRGFRAPRNRRRIRARLQAEFATRATTTSATKCALAPAFRKRRWCNPRQFCQYTASRFSARGDSAGRPGMSRGDNRVCGADHCPGGFPWNALPCGTTEGSRSAPVSPEEQALFLAGIDGTAPLPGRDRVAVPPRRSPSASSTAAHRQPRCRRGRRPVLPRALPVSSRARCRAPNGMFRRGDARPPRMPSTPVGRCASSSYCRQAPALRVSSRPRLIRPRRAAARGVLGELLGPLSALVLALATATPAHAVRVRPTSRCE